MLARHWKAGLLFFAVIAAVQYIGSLVTLPAIPGWYAALNKPAWTPPDAVFGPVWTVLYVLIAIAGWRVWCKLNDAGNPRPMATPAMRTYAAQLLFNFIWSPVFFGLQSPGLGLITIVLLWMLILCTMSFFKKIDRPAGMMFIPYALWVTYAAALNAAIFFMN